MNLNLEGKVALVTGGAKGIGAAIVRSFANEGARVSIVDRNPEGSSGMNSIQDIAGEEDQRILYSHRINGSKLPAKHAVEQTIQKRGRIDFLIHNAGTNDGVDLRSASHPTFIESLRKNLLPMFLALTHYCHGRTGTKTRGAIINIGSKGRRDRTRGHLRLCRGQGSGECI